MLKQQVAKRINLRGHYIRVEDILTSRMDLGTLKVVKPMIEK
jgi:hypothetical protein